MMDKFQAGFLLFMKIFILVGLMVLGIIDFIAKIIKRKV
jgi:hypothetical protein